ncbi:hypothetical protein BP5796_12026 [Coleophoma crateriformis]|uniref:Uncharacterized protein n=1 Tax=Coleophoma crateriformis TaxID=565419 RepID=A0A3D8QB82_9HELO|nr:hypothetical protein BP5796_12026 [Coleophoma crateriformis]
MAGKDHASEPSWRPLAQKLSGLVRNNSAKGKKSSGTTDEKSTKSRFRRQKKPPPEIVPELKLLEVDLDVVEGIHLSEGWLETDTRNAKDNSNEQAPPPAPEKSATPIAGLFTKSVLDFSTSGPSGGLDRFSSPKYGNNDRRPFSMLELGSTTYSRTPADLTSTATPQASGGSILNRGRPVEPKHFLTDSLPKTTGARHKVVPPASDSVLEKAATPGDPSVKASQSSGGRGTTVVTVPNTAVAREPGTAVATAPSTIVVTKPSIAVITERSPAVVTEQNVNELSPGWPAKNLDVDPKTRHSMYAVVTPSPNSVPTIARTPQTSRSASPAPSDRIQAWQKSITSAPTTSVAAARLTSGQGSGSTSAAPPKTDIPVRRASTRGVANRLAWIKELEAKKAGNTNGDLAVLKKQAGTVSDKLAMFENKQVQAANPGLRLPPLTRSNSTTSRLSWVAVDSTSSVNGNITATPRTSIDTVRSSHRASSVMSYYDDSFREKMESIIGDQAPDKENSGSEEKPRVKVTTKFQPVKLELGEEKSQCSEQETSTSMETST